MLGRRLHTRVLVALKEDLSVVSSTHVTPTPGGTYMAHPHMDMAHVYTSHRHGTCIHGILSYRHGTCMHITQIWHTLTQIYK